MIAATNRDLAADIEDGRFRKDLFYRLNVIPIEIPPLRQRPDDIPLLAEAFLRKHGGGERKRITQAAIDVLRRMPWEGNARELENVIERAVALADSEVIDVADLPIEGQASASGGQGVVEAAIVGAIAEQLTLAELGDRYTAMVLEHTRGNKARAASILGINRRTLYRRGFGPYDSSRRDAGGHQDEAEA